MVGLWTLFTASLALIERVPDPRVGKHEGASRLALDIEQNALAREDRNTARYQANLQLVTISEVVSLPAVEINDVSASYFVPFLIGDIEVKDARKHHQSEINQFANVVVTVDTTKEMPEDVCPSPSPSSIWDIWPGKWENVHTLGRRNLIRALKWTIWAVCCAGATVWDILWNIVLLPQSSVPIVCAILGLLLVCQLVRSAIPGIRQTIRKLTLEAILKSRLAQVDQMEFVGLLMMPIATTIFPGPWLFSWFIGFSVGLILNVVATDTFFESNKKDMGYLSIGASAFYLAAAYGYVGSALYYGKTIVLHLMSALKSLSFFEATALTFLLLQLLAILYGVVALSKKLADDAPICQDFNAKQTGAWKFLEKDTNIVPARIIKNARDELHGNANSSIAVKHEIEALNGNTHVENAIDRTASWIKNVVRKVLPA